MKLPSLHEIDEAIHRSTEDGPIPLSGIIDQHDIFRVTIQLALQMVVSAPEDKKMNRKVIHHTTKPIQVWADVDEGIFEVVAHLNAIPGVRTHASCQGTIVEGGAEPYPAYVMVSWWSDAAREVLEREYRLVVEGPNHGKVHLKCCTGSTLDCSRSRKATGE